ncbi:MAG TPA: glutathione S-transferase family protein [Candidatus Eisenbacteria bacterium]|nr:glutathione S-transferase family protein [Candidatus Eisenbacteria bacterium]
MYRIFGVELSPYSVKVRSYFRYKRIPHEWVVRDVTRMDEYNRYAKLPLIPLVVTPEGTAMQDSTPIIEKMEALHPEPALDPADPGLAFLSALIEEYADEWGNKPMFHYRWFYQADADSAADRIAHSMNPGLDADALPTVTGAVKGRMVPRLAFVGSSPQTKDAIEASFHRQLAILEAHLAMRPYLFGGRPALGDFGLFAQLYECSTDPTPGAVMRAKAPRTLAWIARMLDPTGEGAFEPWERLEPTLLPLLRDEIGAVFFPWTLANAQALAAGAKELTCTLEGKPFAQEPQKYHAKSLAALRARYAKVAGTPWLDGVLERAGCLAGLRGS